MLSHTDITLGIRFIKLPIKYSAFLVNVYPCSDRYLVQIVAEIKWKWKQYNAGTYDASNEDQ